MKTIFDKVLREEIIKRIDILNESSSSQWGKMNVYQMLKHCTMWDEWVLGINKPSYQRALIGYIFGKIALRSLVKNDNPLSKNTPTTKNLIIKETKGNIELYKKNWKELINKYENYSNPDFIHDFFGKMTVEEIGILAYKHTDHHLRQFNA